VGRSAPFRLSSRGLLLTLVSATFAGQAQAAAGRVDFATAGATVSGPDGQQRPLARGTDINSGDTIRTDAGGRAQIRFQDGAYVSLQPNTEFAIKEYNFDGKADGSERGFFSLAKGAMRAVTGLIGRVNKNRYQISTPTATIGIRGTGGLIAIGADGSTLVTGTSGIWTISNAAGTIDIPAGVTGKAPTAPNQPPQQTSEKPATPPPPPTTVVEISPATQRTDTGASAVVTNAVVPLQSGSGYAAAVAYLPNGPSSGAAQTSTTNLDGVFTSTGQLTSIQPSTPSFGFGFTLISGSNMDFGTDGILAWGRWVGTVSQNCDCINPVTYGPNQGFHYVVGIPTAAMPTVGTGVAYLPVGSTSPTYNDGSSAPGKLTSASLTVDFGFSTGTTRVRADLGISMMDGKGYVATGTTTTSTSLFSMGMTVTGTGGGCSCGGCSGQASGFFAGASAERAGLAYSINDSFAGQSISGATALKKQ